MVIKAKLESTVIPIKDGVEFTALSLPSLDGGDSPGFKQPVEEEEVEPELTEQEIAQIQADELKAIKDAAYQEGLELGKKEGLAAAKQQIDQQSQMMSRLILELTQPLKQCGEKTQQQLLELAFAIARQIVRRELQQDPTQLIAIIRDGLKALPIGDQKVTIHLHPEDSEIIKQKLSLDEQDPNLNMINEEEKLNQTQTVSSKTESSKTESSKTESSKTAPTKTEPWQISADPTIERGGCLITTKNSKIEASIDKQVAVLFSQVAGGLRQGESDEDEVMGDHSGELSDESLNQQIDVIQQPDDKHD